MGSVTKRELAERVAGRAGLTKREADVIIGIVLASIAEALRNGDKVELRGFGSFRASSRGARQGYNPRTGAVVWVSAKRVPVFKAGKELRERVWEGMDDGKR